MRIPVTEELVPRAQGRLHEANPDGIERFQNGLIAQMVRAHA